MSEHCQYIVFPGDSRDPFVVETHPYDKLISDDLGGATPEWIFLNQARVAMWVRETAAADGSERNITASIIATLLNNWQRPILIIGPACLTSLVPLGRDGDGVMDTATEGFDGVAAQALVAVAADVCAAVHGSDGPFRTPGLDDLWPGKVRAFATAILARRVPADWPVSEGLAPPADEVCALFERAFPGKRFAPLAVQTPLS